MPGDGDNGASVSFSRLQPLVEPADVRVAIGLEPHGAGGGFYKSPFEIVVDVAAGSTMADAPTGCDDARHESCIAGQVFCVREAGNVADFQPDQRRENFTQAGDVMAVGRLRGLCRLFPGRRRDRLCRWRAGRSGQWLRGCGA